MTAAATLFDMPPATLATGQPVWCTVEEIRPHPAYAQLGRRHPRAVFPCWQTAATRHSNSLSSSRGTASWWMATGLRY